MSKPSPTAILNTDFRDSFKINLGVTINTAYSDLFPVVTPDESMLFFTRKGAPENAGFAERPDDEDIYYAMRRADGGWTQSQRLGEPLNTTIYDGVRAVNRTGTRIYLQNQYRTDGTRGKGFSMSERSPTGAWKYPEPIEIANYYNDTNTAMMTVSNDEDFMILSLKRKDSFGAHDLYLSKRIGGMQWSAPIRIDAISSAGDEISPFIGIDDRTLYFSTNGRGGYGLHDIFIAHREDDSWLKWSEPRNLGRSINTPSFDAYFTVTGRGDTAYFSSAHQSSTRGFGKSDIWKVGLRSWMRPGYFLPEGQIIDEEDKKAFDEFPLPNSLFRLEKVLFDVDRSAIRANSKESLDQLVNVMKQRSHISIEVQGHTDNDASDEHNMSLSLDRANSVKKYLIDHGIDPTRITAKGYGAKHPIAPNDSPDGKQLNRRVMILVTSQ